MAGECPYCGHPVEAGDPYRQAWAEVRHMRERHPEIIIQRLRQAGMHQEAEAFGRELATDCATIFEEVAEVLDRRNPIEMAAMAEAMRIHARQEREV